MKRRLLRAALPVSILIGIMLTSTILFGGGCVPPATCAGTELSLVEGIVTLFTEPWYAFFGVFMIFGMLTLSIAGGFVGVLFVYGGLFYWIYRALRGKKEDKPAE